MSTHFLNTFFPLLKNIKVNERRIVFLTVYSNKKFFSSKILTRGRGKSLKCTERNEDKWNEEKVCGAVNKLFIMGVHYFSKMVDFFLESDKGDEDF